MADHYTTGRGKPEAGMVWADRFKLEHQAGRGPGGMLWRAQCLTTRQTKALRILAENLLLPAGHERELRGVIARFSALRLPGVAAPEELVGGPAGAAIVSAWIDGKNLAEHRLEAGGCLPADELRRIAVQLARALVPLHRLSQVHGALRPANVFVDAAGSVVVGDTGSAWWVGEALMRLGNQSAVMAAMPYWSYERAMGDPASRADDIHAYGAILYELATGKTAVPANAFGLPASAKPPPAIAARRREAGLQPAAIDEDLDRLIIACLAREPSARPASLESLLKALGEGADDASAPLDTFQTMPADQIREAVASAPPLAATETVDPVPPPPGPLADPDPAPVTVQEPVAIEQTIATPVTQPESRATAPAVAVPVASAAPPAAAVVQLPAASPAPASSIHYGEKKKKGSNGPVIAGGVIFAVLAGVFIWYQAREPAPPFKTEATQPAAMARTLLDDLLDAIHSLPADAGEDAVTALQAKIAASLPNLTPEEQGRLQQAWQPRQQAFEQTLAEKRIGSIEIISTPAGAEVWSGTERLGVTPLILKDRPTGRHTLELRLRGHVTLPVEVEVAGGKTTAWQGALQRAKGVLRVESNASGDLFEVTEVASAAVVARGTTPQNLTLPAGEYRVAVERSGHKTLEQRVEVTGEAEAKVEARFPEGRLKVEAPPGTMVSLGGVVRGMAPIELNLPAGEHIVTVEYPGGAKEERRVQIMAAGQLDLKFQPGATKPATVPVANKPAETTRSDPVKQDATAVDYNRVFDLREVTRQPVPVTQVAPTMPVRFRQRGVDGLVEISAVIDRFGSVQNIVVLRSTHVELNQATIAAAGQWKFRPAEKDGRAVAVRVVLPFEFNLRGR